MSYMRYIAHTSVVVSEPTLIGIDGREVGSFFSLITSLVSCHHHPSSSNLPPPILLLLSQPPPSFLLHLDLDLLLLHLLESARRHLIKPQQRLIRVLDKHILALIHLQAHIHNRAHNAPSVREVQVHLLGELARVVAHDAEHDVPVVDLGGGAGDEAVRWFWSVVFFGARVRRKVQGKPMTQALRRFTLGGKRGLTQASSCPRSRGCSARSSAPACSCCSSSPSPPPHRADSSVSSANPMHHRCRVLCGRIR